MTVDEGTIVARAISDGQDRLLSADEPLAALQLRCGGDIPGMIAVPELLDLVGRARRACVRMTQAISAQDGNDAITFWVEADPEGEGCAIVVRSWQTAALISEDGAVAEERRVAIDRQIAELTAWLDSGQRLIAANTDCSELAPLADAMAQGVGRCWTDFLQPENVTHQQPLHWRLLDGGPVVFAGSSRPWRVSLIPQIRPGFEPSGFELLLLSDQAPSDCVAIPQAAAPVPPRGLVGQDLAPVLKQPIARIVANAETIRTRLAGPLPDAYAEYAGEIAGAGKLLLDLLDDMADLEVVEADSFSTTADYIDLSDVARQAAGILGVRAREKGISITTPAPADSAPALAEFRRVLQVLLNLIGNAIRYSPEGTSVDVRVDVNGDRARAIVADEGPGLSLEEQGRVFEKFERLGRSGDGGSGLGLYISRRLARAMNGELSIESAPGQGARFILEVPLDPEG
ncbi:histidine kinase [Novosphingobium guangzhouense]|uniref:histidine kinase n=1 Tax=Novosphingobium guangzhouense TaxID=1850347 RepID=A0A2K2G5A5_9SPHN|nr:sensor histidine kinase [Novosphingobium guangzhouense]PNU06215.1 histidine kinase [Novosphingobium guangzhouense]